MYVSQYKSSKARPNSQGQRRYERKQQGYGGQTKPIFKKKAKTTKKIALRLKCTVCAKTQQTVLQRAKTFILATETQRKAKAAAVSY
jgi:large subunit ribosomal protein L44e